ncbi:MAG: DNA topoisomerase VI subunit B [Promethearchaeota archaeon]
MSNTAKSKKTSKKSIKKASKRSTSRNIPKKTSDNTKVTTSLKKPSEKRTLKITQKANSSKISEKKETGDIQEASIAKFMRKRTQLVGFDYGLFKHTQYAVEFTDNALDAIEKYQWDSINTLERLKNHLGRISYEFEKFDNKVQLLIESIEKEETNTPDKELINRLINLYKQKPKIVENISEIQEEYLDKMGLDFSFLNKEYSHDDVEKPETIKKINTTNFLKEYKDFITEYNVINEKYDQTITRISDLEKESRFMFTLDKELSLENLKYQKDIDGNIASNLVSFLDDVSPSNDREKAVESIQKNIINPLNLDITPDSVINSTTSDVEVISHLDDTQKKVIRKSHDKKEEAQKSINKIKDSLDDFITPVLEIVDNEPFVILKLIEEETPEVYWEKGDRSNSYLYTFQVFDNGSGMKPNDLRKFGKYLASSKSQKLRQTRGSQGFGSPSAFNDAQNTTGRPITVVSKHSTKIFGICSEFYTTEKNTKEYVVPPQELECPFLHGTYIKLQYLNRKYTRGYVDTYVEKAAMMNPHISFIYVDPYSKEHIYPRRVSSFPDEPKFALPHPSSIKIGEFQDLLRDSNNLTVTAFLTDNFIRISNLLAKKIVSKAEFEIEQKLEYLDLDVSFLSIIPKISVPLRFIREEQRIYGRSSKPRSKFIAYEIPESDFKNIIWENINKYCQNLKKKNSTEKKLRKIDNSLNKESDRNRIKEKRKQIKTCERKIKTEIKLMMKLKKKIKNLIKNPVLSEEINDEKIIEKEIKIIKELMISKTKPNELTQTQIEFLYMAFKDQKYMAPPTDTAVPVGEMAMETVLIKKYNLTISNRTDYYFGNPTKKIEQIGTFERDNLIEKNLIRYSSVKISNLDLNFSNVFSYNSELKPQEYSNLIMDMDLIHTIGDDFIAACTRSPTSGKGLAFVVETVMAYSPNNIPSAKKAASVVSRYVNRTPKIRDNSGCALWRGIQNVNWKNYKVSETFDNGIPKGNYVVLINCSGPYTHLMFKSQSKNALAEDEVLLKEVKLCLEVIGRKLKKYMNKREIRDQRAKRSKLIEKSVPSFLNSLYNIASTNSKYEYLNRKDLEEYINETLTRYSSPDKKRKLVKEVEKGVSTKILQDQKEIKITDTTEETSIEPLMAPKHTKTVKIIEGKPKKEIIQTSLDSFELTHNGILNALSDGKWYFTSEIVKKMRITNMTDARFLQIKLKSLATKGLISLGKKDEKKVWKLK